jgi:hypothetical protein
MLFVHSFFFKKNIHAELLALASNMTCQPSVFLNKKKTKKTQYSTGHGGDFNLSRDFKEKNTGHIKQRLTDLFNNFIALV